MEPRKKAFKIMIWGAIPQLTMLALYGWQHLRYGHLIRESQTSIWLWPSHFGFLLFGYCLFILYMIRLGPPDLITNGVFKYTRHPMYTGLFLMNLDLWLPKPVSNELLFYVGQIAFVTCMLIAGWSQEKETLARFGKDAESYYARTPRLFIWYPFMRKA